MNTADFLYEVGALKRTARTGWALARLPNRESVADHSFRTAVIAMTLAAMSGADPDRAATLALLHDLPEARLGDMHHLTRRYLDEPKPFRRVIDDQTENLPPPVREAIRSRAAQWLDQETAEARLARDADTLDSLLHVRESLADRPDLRERWEEYLSAAVTTEAGRTMMAEIRATDPDAWWPRTVST
ncbi:HD domain-containing protein [Actinoplanes sichuanensis]|uniref:5'-deoxynucleotidase n=1 Tax=Actinoplanes sichuanensis TaxID=512349 RepID=A0ABW4APQ8_9ACTN|nr:HD domain-containing protein [Actinoplanes sichuanensis]BEL04838.1 HD domain-containing protein [Actinoplanes sichuanensis]